MSIIVLGFLAVTAASPDALTAEQAIAHYRQVTGSRATPTRQRCDHPAGDGEIVVCARETQRYRLPMQAAQQRAEPGSRILHPGEVPKSSGVIDVAPCPPSTGYCPKVGQTIGRILSWITGSDPD